MLMVSFFRIKYDQNDPMDFANPKIDFSGADLDSMSFLKLRQFGILDRNAQDYIAGHIRNGLIGPSYYPYTCFRPRPVTLFFFISCTLRLEKCFLLHFD